MTSFVALLAAPGSPDYGVLTLLVHLRYQPQDWFKIPAGCFFPAPDVDSGCVLLTRRPKSLLGPEETAVFVRVVKRSFSQRRKMMLKLLREDWPAGLLDDAVPLISELYETLPDGDENPLSEGGAWSHRGFAWAKVQKKDGLAYGTQSGFGGYDDSYAYLFGLTPDQEGEAVVHVSPALAGEPHEAELLLRWADSAMSARGLRSTSCWRASSRNARTIDLVSFVRWFPAESGLMTRDIGPHYTKRAAFAC